MIAHSELLERITYNQLTGKLHWTQSLLNRAACRGKEAGSVKTDGYIAIQLDGHLMGAHVLIWFYMTGEWPKTGIDHKDRNPSNNTWLNLRLATKSENAENRGFTGLSWHSRDQYWNVCLQKNGKRYYARDICFGKALKKRNALKQAKHKFGAQSTG